MEAGIEPIMRLIQEKAKRSEGWAKEKAQKIMHAAQCSPNSRVISHTSFFASGITKSSFSFRRRDKCFGSGKKRI
jgi:hypothetical protein